MQEHTASEAQMDYGVLRLRRAVVLGVRRGGANYGQGQFERYFTSERTQDQRMKLESIARHQIHQIPIRFHCGLHP